MGKASRDKGKRGEREVAALIWEMLEINVERDQNQSARGGHDLIGMDDWAIEVKRYAEAGLSEIATWWEQTKTQATRAGKSPVLFYRLDRQPWHVMIDGHDVAPDVYSEPGFARFTMSPDCWAHLVRSRQWPENRMDAIGQNGNEGEHYAEAV